MKYGILVTIRAYQLFLSPFLGALFPTCGCRFFPTCSEYTYKEVKMHGVAKGMSRGVVRLIKCNPWTL